MKPAMRIRRLFTLAIVVAVGSTWLAAQESVHWVASWAAAQQLVEPQNNLPESERNNVTLRQIIHLSLGGPSLRLVVSNRFGTMPLHIDSVHIARAIDPGSSKIDAISNHEVTFSGREDAAVPAGADYVSDPIEYAAAPFSDLAITLHLEAVPKEQTGHPGSRSTSYCVHGNLVSTAELPQPKTVEHWYFIAGVEVASPSSAAAIVALGDSITDGHGATTNGNDRWPDILARRLRANSATQNLAVVNEGIGGNRLLLEGLGPDALSRINEDVIAQPGARYVILLEGVNDIGMLGRADGSTPAQHKEIVEGIIAAYEQTVARAHTFGIAVFGCTILPFVGSSFYHPGAQVEADRQAINKWIRATGHFDAVIDFDRLMADPAAPDRMLAKYDSGDHLHPSPQGYAAMANAIPLALFNRKYFALRLSSGWKGYRAARKDRTPD
jgi:lysophospholipase L1-like esterase